MNEQSATFSDGTRQFLLYRRSTLAIWPGNVQQKLHCTSEYSHYRRKRAKLLPPPALQRASLEQRHPHGANESPDRPSKPACFLPPNSLILRPYGLYTARAVKFC